MALTPTRKAKLAANTFTGLQEFSGTTHAGLKLNSLTTAQRNALTTANGMLIYNTTTETFQKYEAGAWVDVSSGGTPAAHATSHQNGGSDEISVAGLSGLLADGQTPTTHAASHANGGSDPVKLDDLATPDDNTDLNASTTRHGLLRKLDNSAVNFLNGQGGWSVPSATPLELYDENPVSPTTPNASGSNAVAIGNGAAASGTNAIAIGLQCSATSSQSVALGYDNDATGIGALATGANSWAKLYGQHAHASGQIGAIGDAQTAVLVSRIATTNATPSVLFLDGVSSRQTLDSFSTVAFKIMVVARRTDASENDAWEFKGLIHRDNLASSTTLDALQSNQIGATAWACGVTANPTNGALQIDVVGAAAKDIQWVARIETTETSG